MKTLKPNGQRAKKAITLIWIVFSLEIVSFISGYFQYDLLQSAANGATIITPLDVTLNDLREQSIGVLYLVVYIVSTVTFIQWFRRAYFNLHLRVDNLLHPEGWAAGSWFVPIISLFRPYQIMEELYNESNDLLEKKGLNVNGLSTKYLFWWWALWILSSLVGQVVIRYTLNAESLDDMIFATTSGMFQNIINIPLALLAIKVIKDYSKVEPILFDMKDEEEVQEETLIAE
jgi:hypothetical protein